MDFPASSKFDNNEAPANALESGTSETMAKEAESPPSSPSSSSHSTSSPLYPRSITIKIDVIPSSTSAKQIPEQTLIVTESSTETEEPTSESGSIEFATETDIDATTPTTEEGNKDPIVPNATQEEAPAQPCISTRALHERNQPSSEQDTSESPVANGHSESIQPDQETDEQRDDNQDTLTHDSSFSTETFEQPTSEGPVASTTCRKEEEEEETSKSKNSSNQNQFSSPIASLAAVGKSQSLPSTPTMSNSPRESHITIKGESLAKSRSQENESGDEYDNDISVTRRSRTGSQDVVPKSQKCAQMQSKRHQRRRKVCFPSDQEMVTEYLEAPDPWSALTKEAQLNILTPENIVDAYKRACSKQGIRPLDQIIEQLEGISQFDIRQQDLNLSTLKLNYCQCEALEEIFKRVRFRHLNLTDCGLDDEAAQALFDIIEYYESAIHLNLSKNPDIDSRGWQTLARLLKKTPCITHLDLSEIKMTEQYLLILTRTLRSSIDSHLVSLHLESCGINGRCLAILAAALKLNTTLKELYLGDNQINGHDDGQQLCNILKANTTLELLDLRNNTLGDNGVAILSDGLCSQPTNSQPGEGLKILNLCSNGIHLSYQGADDGGRQARRSSSDETDGFVAAIPLAPSLVMLNLGSNPLGDDGLRRLKTAILRSSSLSFIGLSGIGISSFGASHIADMIKLTTVIKRIDLRDNDLTLKGLRFIRDALQANSSIIQVDLSLRKSLTPEIVKPPTIAYIVPQNPQEPIKSQITPFSGASYHIPAPVPHLTCPLLSMEHLADYEEEEQRLITEIEKLCIRNIQNAEAEFDLNLNQKKPNDSETLSDSTDNDRTNGAYEANRQMPSSSSQDALNVLTMDEIFEEPSNLLLSVSESLNSDEDSFSDAIYDSKANGIPPSLLSLFQPLQRIQSSSTQKPQYEDQYPSNRSKLSQHRTLQPQTFCTPSNLPNSFTNVSILQHSNNKGYHTIGDGFSSQQAARVSDSSTRKTSGKFSRFQVTSVSLDKQSDTALLPGSAGMISSLPSSFKQRSNPHDSASRKERQNTLSRTISDVAQRVEDGNMDSLENQTQFLHRSGSLGSWSQKKKTVCGNVRLKGRFSISPVDIPPKEESKEKIREINDSTRTQRRESLDKHHSAKSRAKEMSSDVSCETPQFHLEIDEEMESGSPKKGPDQEEDESFDVLGRLRSSASSSGFMAATQEDICQYLGATSERRRGSTPHIRITPKMVSKEEKKVPNLRLYCKTLDGLDLKSCVPLSPTRLMQDMHKIGDQLVSFKLPPDLEEMIMQTPLD